MPTSMLRIHHHQFLFYLVLIKNGRVLSNGMNKTLPTFMHQYLTMKVESKEKLEFTV